VSESPESNGFLFFIISSIILLFLIPAIKANWRNETMKLSLLIAFTLHIAVQPLFYYAYNAEMIFYIAILGDFIIAIMAMFFFESFIYFMFGALFLAGIAFNGLGIHMFLDETITNDQIMTFNNKLEPITIGLTILQSLLLLWVTFYAELVIRYVSSFIGLCKRLYPLRNDLPVTKEKEKRWIKAPR